MSALLLRVVWARLALAAAAQVPIAPRGSSALWHAVSGFLRVGIYIPVHIINIYLEYRYITKYAIYIIKRQTDFKVDCRRSDLGLALLWSCTFTIRSASGLWYSYASADPQHP
jgi:hypothetical protein